MRRVVCEEGHRPCVPENWKNDQVSELTVYTTYACSEDSLMKGSARKEVLSRGGIFIVALLLSKLNCEHNEYCNFRLVCTQLTRKFRFTRAKTSGPESNRIDLHT